MAQGGAGPAGAAMTAEPASHGAHCRPAGRAEFQPQMSEICHSSEHLVTFPSPAADNVYDPPTRTILRAPASNGASGFEQTVDICAFDVINVT
jgi:hypothetical protein